MLPHPGLNFIGLLMTVFAGTMEQSHPASQIHSLQECTVTDLDDLSFDMFSHIRCQEQTGIGLIFRFTFRSREIHKMLAVVPAFWRLPAACPLCWPGEPG